MSKTMTTSLGTSHLRGSSRQTRTNPTRTSKTAGPSLRRTSLISNPPFLLQDSSEPHGFYPAIQHFADAIAALPRDYRRHTSLLKEVDAKAWQPEEDLQGLLAQCTAGAPVASMPTSLHSAVGSTINATDEGAMMSAANSVVGAPIDAASLYSNDSTASAVNQRRQLFAALRHNLMQSMVTMDEKNHVINNANEELSRHIRRLDHIHPHLADEISDEARLGSLKHWAYTETNPTKKNAPPTRREAAANLALLHDNEVTQRSELRREAVAAKKNRLAQSDAGFEEIRTVTKKTVAEGKRRAVDNDASGLGITGAGPAKRKRPEKSLASVAMDKSMSTALGGSRPMSRESSQQDVPKKRKAPAANATVARKRLNANQDSPQLASSPLAGSFGKDAYKRSPALGAARPVSSRARQNSGQVNRPPSSTSQRNAHGAGVGAQDTHNKNATSSKDTYNKGDRFTPSDAAGGPNGDATSRSNMLLERRVSKQGVPRTDTIEKHNKATASPRLSIATSTNNRGRASKISTPVVGTFNEATRTNSNGNDKNKNQRAARIRAKDHGLHDSLSPKGLPLKRSHKKGAGLSAHQNSFPFPPNGKGGIENTTPPNEDSFSPSADLDADGEGQSADDDNNSVNMEEGVEENIHEADVEEEDEETYCYCGGPSYGEMVACDNDDCPRQWFHIECLGLKTVPKSASWYCSECRGHAGDGGGSVRGKKVNGGGGGR